MPAISIVLTLPKGAQRPRVKIVPDPQTAAARLLRRLVVRGRWRAVW